MSEVYPPGRFARAGPWAALLASGDVRCWGSNLNGQLGDGTTNPHLTPWPVLLGFSAVAIAVGDSHSCALLANGTAKCWGAGGSGQIGDGFQINRLSPVSVFGVANVVALAGGSSHTCALQVSGFAACWGGNSSGQLGHGDTTLQVTPVNVKNISDTVPAVGIAAGLGHSCALVAGGGAKCWGDNGEGELGNNTLNPSLIPIDVTVNVCTFVSTRGGGGSFICQPKPIASTVNIKTGRRHSCVLFAFGGLSCWGENTFGQLGIGSTTNQAQPVTVPSFTVNIDPRVSLESNSRVTTVTIIATCEAGRQLQVEVTLTQGTVSGRGSGVGQCTGGLERYPVAVTAQGADPFAAGPAQVSAEALIRDFGISVETQAWKRQVQLVAGL